MFGMFVGCCVLVLVDDVVDGVVVGLVVIVVFVLVVVVEIEVVLWVGVGFVFFFVVVLYVVVVGCVLCLVECFVLVLLQFGEGFVLVFFGIVLVYVVQVGIVGWWNVGVVDVRVVIVEQQGKIEEGEQKVFLEWYC